jgi:hypothetical protein
LTLLVANISPTAADLSQSISTLRFATRAKAVKTTPAKIEVAEGDDEETAILKATIAKLTAKLKDVALYH